MKEPLWVTGNATIMDSSVCVLKGLVGNIVIDKYGSVLVKSLEIGKKVFTDMKSIPIFLNKWALLPLITLEGCWL